MKRLDLIAPLAVIGLAGCSASAVPVVGPGAHAAIPACSGSRVGRAQCDVLVELGVHPASGGWSAKDLETAYDLPTNKGKGQSVFIVDAYGNPNVKSDFATYRAAMGLPAGKLKVYNPYKGKHPPDSAGWGVEVDLDVEMASASCPNCTIDLVVAKTNSWSDIEAAVKKALKLGATIISNSYSGSGASKSPYDRKGVTYVASTGDDGYGVYEPAGFTRVISVGGTSMSTGGGKRGYTEEVWPDTAGGCSSAPKPKWQHDPDCQYRTANDVAAVAVGAAEYDTYFEGGWLTVDGTSIGSPLVAGMVGLAGNSTKQDGGRKLWTLSKTQQQRDLYYISQGSNGQCGGTYLCTAGTMQFGTYSGPAGWGTPHGVGAL